MTESREAAEKCHCGRLAVTNITLGSSRGMCEQCDLARCDAYPDDCPHALMSPREASAGASRLLQQARAEAWWRGVNDQWKHLPQGARLIEFANPYRDPKKLSDWIQPTKGNEEK